MRPRLLELNTLAMKSRITRKEQLLANVYQNMIDLAEDSTTKLDTLLGDMLQVNYYESCFSIQRGIGLGFSVAKISDKLIKQVLSFPWSEKHYPRPWGACDHLRRWPRGDHPWASSRGAASRRWPAPSMR